MIISPGAGRRIRPRSGRPWLRRGLTAAVLALFAAELAVGWPSLTSALGQLRAPRPTWLIAALALEIAAMTTYARMQRRLLHSAGVHVPLHRQLALTFAAHSLNETLPGGPAFSTQLNFRQMRRFGATPAVASWCIALSGVLSAAALAVITAAGAVAAHGSPDWPTLIGLAATILLVTIGLRRITRRSPRLEPILRAGLHRLNRIRHRPAADGLEQAARFFDQLQAARLTPGHGLAAAVYALLNWLLDAIGLWLCVYAIDGRGLSATQLLLAFGAGMAAGTITITPGGLGIIDSALVLGLVGGGLDAPTSIAAVVLYRLITLGLIIGARWIAWLAIRRRAAVVEVPSPQLMS